MASIPLTTARRRVPTSCSSGRGTRTGPSSCKTNSSRGGKDTSHPPVPAKQTPLEEVAGAPQYHSVAEQSLSLQEAAHSILATALAKQSPLQEVGELHLAGGEDGVEEALSLQEAACSCLTPPLAIQASLQEVAKLRLAGGKGGDQVSQFLG